MSNIESWIEYSEMANYDDFLIDVMNEEFDRWVEEEYNRDLILERQMEALASRMEATLAAEEAAVNR
jgi:hypothetical protein